MTYHESCHLSYLLGVKNEPRSLLQLAGDLIEVPEGQRCCGMGGVFALMKPDLSSQMGLDRAKALAATGADRLVTGCPGCMMQLGERLSSVENEMPVRHTWEILAGEGP